MLCCREVTRRIAYQSASSNPGSKTSVQLSGNAPWTLSADGSIMLPGGQLRWRSWCRLLQVIREWTHGWKICSLLCAFYIYFHVDENKWRTLVSIFFFHWDEPRVSQGMPDPAHRWHCTCCPYGQLGDWPPRWGGVSSGHHQTWVYF